MNNVTVRRIMTGVVYMCRGDFEYNHMCRLGRLVWAKVGLLGFVGEGGQLLYGPAF